MDKGLEIARGKTKALNELAGQPDVAVMRQFDTISAGDGARKHELPGKGRIAAITTSRVLRLLNLCGLPTHYLRGGEDDDANEMLVRRCTMIPLEVVVRGVAAGSLVTRRPGIQRGALLIPRMVEFFYKDDINHDPLIDAEDVVARGIASPNEVAMMSEIARLAYEILAHAWRRRDTLMVDVKFEFGRISAGEGKGNLLLADVIDNDSWRIWPQGREDLMLDKQLYRNMQEPSRSDLARVLEAYEHVAELVGSFPVMRPAMVATLCDSPDSVATAETLGRSLAQYGIPMARHITSLTRTPGHILSLIQQLDAAFARLIFVTIGSAEFRDLVEHATPTPVMQLEAGADAASSDMLALRAAKSFGLDDTVLFGRTLLMQGNMRASVMQADAQLNAGTAQPSLNVPVA